MEKEKLIYNLKEAVKNAFLSKKDSNFNGITVKLVKDDNRSVPHRQISITNGETTKFYGGTIYEGYYYVGYPSYTKFDGICNRIAMDYLTE